MTVLHLDAIRACRSPDPYERRQAGRELARAAGSPAVDAQLRRLIADPDRHVGQLAIDVLVQRADPPAARLLAGMVGTAVAIHDSDVLDNLIDTIVWQDKYEAFLALAGELLDSTDDRTVRHGAVVIVDALS